MVKYLLIMVSPNNPDNRSLGLFEQWESIASEPNDNQVAPQSTVERSDAETDPPIIEAAHAQQSQSGLELSDTGAPERESLYERWTKESPIQDQPERRTWYGRKVGMNKEQLAAAAAGSVAVQSASEQSFRTRWLHRKGGKPVASMTESDMRSVIRSEIRKARSHPLRTGMLGFLGIASLWVLTEIADAPSVSLGETSLPVLEGITSPELSSPSRQLNEALASFNHQAESIPIDAVSEAVWQLDLEYRSRDPDRQAHFPYEAVKLTTLRETPEVAQLIFFDTKTMPFERYAASPQIIAVYRMVNEAAARIIEEGIVAGKYPPEFRNGSLEVRDITSPEIAGHTSHDGYTGDFGGLVIHPHEIRSQSGSVLIDSVNGDKIDIDDTVRLFVFMGRLTYGGERVISSVLYSNTEIIERVNKELGFGFLVDDVNIYEGDRYHYNHGHATFRRRVVKGGGEFRPIVPQAYLDAGYGLDYDLRIGSGFVPDDPRIFEMAFGADLQYLIVANNAGRLPVGSVRAMMGPQVIEHDDGTLEVILGEEN